MVSLGAGYMLRFTNVINRHSSETSSELNNIDLQIFVEINSACSADTCSNYKLINRHFVIDNFESFMTF